MPDARWVSSILSTFVLTNALTNILTPSIGLTAILNATGDFLDLAPNVLFILFASTFGRPLSLLRRWFPAVASALAGVITVRSIVIGVLVWFAPPGNPAMYFFGSGVAWFVATPLMEIASITCGGLAIIATRGAERQRTAWFVGALGVFLSIELVITLVQLLTFGNIAAFDAVSAVSNAIALLTPICLTYAVLNKRLLEVGFILNRAAVFTGVSFVVVGSFVLVEWALSRWLAGADRVSGIAADLGLVLVIGISLRFIHGHVDRFVDRVFFWRRHENEAALRRFGHEAPFMPDLETLVERTISEIQKHADAGSVAILLHEGKGYRSARAPVTSVSENDTAILALRAWHEPIALHRYATAVAGDLAFPMLARGDLRGVLVCGPKRGGETYAPDECDALAALAAGVGSAVDTLMSQTMTSSVRYWKSYERFRIGFTERYNPSVPKREAIANDVLTGGGTASRRSV